VFGLLSGIAFTVKPTVLPLSLVQTVFAGYECWSKRQRWAPHLIASAVAYLVAPAISVAFLLDEGAGKAFFSGFRTVVPYYASLAHRPLSYILVHSVSPVLLIVYIWLALQVVHFGPNRPGQLLQSWERTTLVASALFGLVDCIMQARGLPYYRYPLLAFLLPLMAIDFHRGLNASILDRRLIDGAWRQKAVFGLSATALVVSGFIIAPQSAILIHRYRWWETDFITSLERDLSTLGGSRLSRNVVCIDSVSGCVTVLYRMRLEPASGIPGDFLLFGPESAPVIRQTRQQFSREIFEHPPKVIVVSSHLHLGDADAENFQKLERWPALVAFFAARYTLTTEWHPTRPALWWSRPVMPASYRIYVLRSDTSLRTRHPYELSSPSK